MTKKKGPKKISQVIVKIVYEDGSEEEQAHENIWLDKFLPEKVTPQMTIKSNIGTLEVAIYELNKQRLSLGANSKWPLPIGPRSISSVASTLPNVTSFEPTTELSPTTSWPFPTGNKPHVPPTETPRPAWPSAPRESLRRMPRVKSEAPANPEEAPRWPWPSGNKS